jgi:hypothetical protein
MTLESMKHYSIKTLIVTTLLLFYTALLNGQHSDVILTKEQNKVWLDSLKLLSTVDRIELIRKRILIDTIVFNSKEYKSDRIILENELKAEHIKKYGYISEGRIFFILQYKNTNPKSYSLTAFNWYNSTDSKTIRKFYDFLTIEKIKDIEILDHDEAKTTFSSYPKFGVLIFNLSKKKYIKEFNRMDLNKK